MESIYAEGGHSNGMVTPPAPRPAASVTASLNGATTSQDGASGVPVDHPLGISSTSASASGPAAPVETSASTAAAAAAASNGTHAVYPPNVIPNPAAALPASLVDPVLGALQRPAFIPADLDPRIARPSVWMKTLPESGEAVFFIPNSCDHCRQRQISCDRVSPVCGLCERTNRECTQGELMVLRQAAPPPPPRPVSNPNKGKARAVEPPPADHSDESGDEHHHGTATGATVDLDATEGGRGKRVRKKRRLSASDELDPNLLNFDGTGLRKPRPRASRVSHLPPPRLGPLRPEDVRPSDDDVRYRAAVAANDERPPLTDMRGFCPAWADRRRGLFGAAEYLRNPVPTTGASVDIGASGLARGVVLEGQPSQPGWWGEGARTGTIVAAIGKPRLMRTDHAPLPDEDAPAEPAMAGELNTVMRGTDEPAGIASLASASTTTANGTAAAPRPTSNCLPIPESDVVEALLMANRARTPVAVAVSHDYANVPFKVPRAIVVLGWFWIAEAWTEPLGDLHGNLVTWKFTFEWCSGAQKQPWWAPKSAPEREATPCLEGDAPAWPVRGNGVKGATTLRGAYDERTPPSGLELEEPQSYRTGTECHKCGLWSDQVYAEKTVCLNEGCPKYFADDGNLPIDDTTDPAACRPDTRIFPESLRLSLAPPLPSADASDVQRQNAQHDLWRAWVCRRCRHANERRDWLGYICEACALVDRSSRKVYAADALAPSARIACTGVRPDDGHASWTVTTSSSSVLFPDDSVKVIKHTVPLTPTTTAHVAQAMAPEGAAAAAHGMLKHFQLQGRDEVPFRRENLSATSSRVADLALSPFYTIACGADAPFMSHFPTAPSLTWSESPPSCVDALDYLNERAVRMMPGTRFNSLLVAAMPAALFKAASSATIPVDKDTAVGFLVLGSDCSFKFKRAGVRNRIGELNAQHGDVVLVRATEAVDVDLRMDGFGFVCLGRGTGSSPRPPNANLSTSNGNGNGHAEPHHHHQSASKDMPPPTAESRYDPAAPLAPFYVGPQPVDSTQPLRCASGLRWYPAPEAVKSEPGEPPSPKAAAAEKVAAVLDSDPAEPELELPDPSDTDTLLHPTPWRGIRVYHSDDAAALLDIKTEYDDGDEDEDATPPPPPPRGKGGRGRGRGKARGGAAAAVKGGRVRGRASGAAAGSSGAATPSVIAESPAATPAKAKGAARGRGRAKATRGKSAASGRGRVRGKAAAAGDAMDVHGGEDAGEGDDAGEQGGDGGEGDLGDGAYDDVVME